MQQREIFPAFVEQGVEAAAFVGQVSLQAAQTQVHGLGDAFGAGFAFGQLGFDGGADLALPGQRLKLGEGALEHGFVVFGQLRVGVVQVTVEVDEAEFQAILRSVEMHR